MNSGPPSHGVLHEVLMGGNVPVPGPGRTGMMGGGGGVIPPILLEENRVPRFYRDAICACGATQPNTLPNTALVYNLMVTSGLPRHVLSYVWSAVNRTLPGQLTRPEFYSCLALIALAQKSESLAALSSLSQLPIPHLQTAVVPVTASPVVSVPATSASQTRQFSRLGKFVPTSLMPRWSNSQPAQPKSNVDLLGELAPSTSTQSPETNSSISVSPNVTTADPLTPPKSPNNSTLCTEIPASKPNYDIDWESLTSGDDTLPTGSSLSDHRLSVISRMISAAHSLLKDGEVLLKPYSKSTKKEVFGAERGERYIRALYELNLLLTRISMGQLATSLSSDSRRLLVEGRKIWNDLEQSIIPEATEDGASSITCSLCHCTVSHAQLLEFGGRSFHGLCANLWVNHIESILP